MNDIDLIDLTRKEYFRCSVHDPLLDIGQLLISHADGLFNCMISLLERQEG